MKLRFCDPFDEALAGSGPASVFLLDREGTLRFDLEWTREGWTRLAGEPVRGWTWLLLRHHLTGHIHLALSTSPALLAAHPRADVRAYPSADVAIEALSHWGDPAISREAW